MADKKTVLVTRKLPEAVEARLARDYDARLNPDDRLYSADDLLALSEGAVAIVPCHTERFNAELIERLPASVEAIVNFSVGYDIYEMTDKDKLSRQLMFVRCNPLLYKAIFGRLCADCISLFTNASPKMASFQAFSS